ATGYRFFVKRRSRPAFGSVSRPAAGFFLVWFEISCLSARSGAVLKSMARPLFSPPFSSINASAGSPPRGQRTKTPFHPSRAFAENKQIRRTCYDWFVGDRKPTQTWGSRRAYATVPRHRRKLR